MIRKCTSMIYYLFCPTSDHGSRNVASTKKGGSENHKDGEECKKVDDMTILNTETASDFVDH